MDLLNCLKSVSKFSFEYPILEIWRKGYIYITANKLLVFAKIGVGFFLFFFIHNTHQSHTHNHTSLITYTVIKKKWAHVQRNTGTKTDGQIH